ncbi:MAG: hypothetical protein M0Q88_01025 [Bacilli bacterium]|nr:hypothetical protein [Bacilli bacterium]
MKVTGYVDYVSGYLRSGHYELDLNEEELKEFKQLSEEEQKEYLSDYGDFIVDDYSVEDIGDVYTLNISE